MPDEDTNIECAGSILRSFRDAKGLTQRALAEMLGCSDGFLAYIEVGKRQPSDDFLRDLIVALDIAGEDRDRLVKAVANERQQAAEERLRARYTAKTKQTISTFGSYASVNASSAPRGDTSTEMIELAEAIQTAPAEIKEAVRKLLSHRMSREQATNVFQVVNRIVDEDVLAQMLLSVLKAFEVRDAEIKSGEK